MQNLASVSECPLTTGLVAGALRISEVYVRQLARTGRLPSTLLANGQRIFQPADVDKMQRERSAAGR